MRVSPVPVMRLFGTWYVNIVRNTPLTLIIIFCSLGLYQNLGLALAPENENFIDEQQLLAGGARLRRLHLDVRV